MQGCDHQQVGEYVCKAGKNTGYTCGEIVDRSYMPSYVGSPDATFIRVDRSGSGDMLGAGDSGAPVFNGNTALGIAVAGVGNQYDMIYSRSTSWPTPTSGSAASRPPGNATPELAAEIKSRAGTRGGAVVC